MKKIINSLFYIACYMAILSIYCNVSVSHYNVLNKSDAVIVMCFFKGIFFACIITFLLHYLFRKIPGWVWH